MKFPKPDLHMHTCLSDGSDSPQELISVVKNAKIDVFSVTDHDGIKAGEIIPGLLKDGDPAFINGVEFSCKDENGKYHILGYGMDLKCGDLLDVLHKGHDFRIKKVLARLEHLKSSFGFVFPDKELSALLSLNNPGKPHIANLLVKYGYAETTKNAITDYIDKKTFKSEYVRPEEAIYGILSSGGVPVLAHPFYGDGGQLILGDEMKDRLFRLKEYGLQGIEAFYSGFTRKLESEALSLADSFDFYITCGSDYHGTNKLNDPGDTGLVCGEFFPDRLKAFLKRTGYPF